jgi:twitching motility two-component system response regulator PilH
MSHLVLVIDDDEIERALLQRCLESAGYRVFTAADGESGVDLVREHQPDLVVLDIVMPRLNGYQTCRRLRAEPSTASIPVLVLTSKDQDADRLWAGEAGASAFLTKPVDVTRLLATASALLGTT